MRKLGTLIIASLVTVPILLVAQETKPTESRNQQGEREVARKGASWTQILKEGAKRDMLHDAFQVVRGDSGKWNDNPILQHAPPMDPKPAKMSLDDWADQCSRQKTWQQTSNDDNWLLFRTRQLDDNDRVWIERIERKGNQFTVVLNEAIWQGRYSKTFTYYGAFGVNLGKLEPGKYEVKWIIKPLAFKQFQGDGRPTDNWPKDERPTDREPTELSVSFGVIAKVLSNGRPQ